MVEFKAMIKIVKDKKYIMKWLHWLYSESQIGLIKWLKLEVNSEALKGLLLKVADRMILIFAMMHVR